MASQPSQTERSLLSHLSQLAKMLDDYSQSTGAKARKKTKALTVQFENTEKVLNNVEAETRTLPTQARTRKIAETREKRTLLRQLKRKFRDIQYEQKHGKKMAELNDKGKKQRGKLLKTQNDIEKADASLDNTTRLAEEAKEIGQNIIGEVRRQNGVLSLTNDRVTGLDNKTKKGAKIVREMSNRELRIKYCLCCCFMLQVTCIIFLFWFRWINPFMKCVAPTRDYLSTYGWLHLMGIDTEFVAPNCGSHP